MSIDHASRHRTKSIASHHSASIRQTPPPTSLTPESGDHDFEACATTASFLLYAQRNQILVLHHDTLSIERRFELHREDVLWIAVDNVSERGSGRLAVSFDTGKTAIVWDILSGGEIARFSAYEHMRIATFMRSGNIAFGNDQGNVILFEPATSEHLSARTIFDPITALAPASDCRTFAIGYLNGSTLIATLQPHFTIIHTLNTTKSPSRITGLAWHGSSSKQKTDMLATQTADGDLRVWSVPKQTQGQNEAPTVIRVLSRQDMQMPSPNWVAWSKSGRILQYADNETRSWDVRTKKVTYDIIPTVDGVTGIANYGSSATLFALGRNHTVYQYDVNPSSTPLQVASAQHAPANTPPTPPTMLEERKAAYGASTTGDHPIQVMYSETESSADESGALSPLQKIAMEMDSLDALESELRDKVMPLSPSSRASSISSKSSGRRSRGRKYLYDKPSSSRASESTGFEGTEFSFGAAPKPGHESMSIRSVSSYTSASNARHARRTSNLRKEVLRSPQETDETANMDLFLYTKARLRDVVFRTPDYGNATRTADLLQREMLSVVFGWDDDVRGLIQDELTRHRPGSASAVLLAKWLGDMGADSMASMVGSESMTSSDWMLLALSSIGADSQKKVGEAFVQRLLEKGDIHPAVAILLGLGENNDAIEVYVSQSYWMEAVLLTCLTCPSDWQRTSHLVRKWGENAVQQGQPELAVRCFSCTSVETSEPWFSPRAQDAVYAAQQQRLMQPLSPTSPPNSPPSRSGSGRMTQKNASLKLITSFGDKGAPLDDPRTVKPGVTTAIGFTPIAQSALSPGGSHPWRMGRETSLARTATPGGFTRKKRLPSRSDIERAKQEAQEIATPMTAARDKGRRTASRTTSRAPSIASIPEPATAVATSRYDSRSLAPSETTDDDYLPSPAKGAFSRIRGESQSRKERKPDGLSVQVYDTSYGNMVTPGPTTNASEASAMTGQSRSGALSPGPLTGVSMKSGKARAIDQYINSVEVARQERAQSRQRNPSRKRGESRAGRGTSRVRDPSESRGADNVRVIKPAKRSPSSPVPMSPEEIQQATFGSLSRIEPVTAVEPATTDDENFYKLTSPTESNRSGTRFGSRQGRRPSEDRAAHLAPLKIGNDRGRSSERDIASAPRSPSLPMLSSKRFGDDADEVKSEGVGFRLRAQSTSRQPGDELQSRRIASRSRQQSTDRRGGHRRDLSTERTYEIDDNASEPAGARTRGLTRKQVAAQELEARRRSLARRPSAPAIPMPGDFAGRPGIGQRSHTELGDSPTSFSPPLSRSQTVDPDAMSKYNTNSKITGTSTSSTPIGLPATPRAMRHPRYMSSDPNEREGGPPPVPEIPNKYSDMPSGLTESAVSGLSSRLSSDPPASNPSEVADSLGPLLPATVYGQKSPLGPPRSASAPPEKQALKAGQIPSPRRMSGSRNQVRKITPADAGIEEQGPTSIDAALHADDQVIIIPDEEHAPTRAVLPELQHLAGPPPPPPPPPMFSAPQGHIGSGVIDIAIDDNAPSNTIDPQGPMLPLAMDRAQTVSPAMHRKNAPSSDSFGSRLRGFGDRMRSSSKSRVKSPAEYRPAEYKPAPYETVLPPFSYGQTHAHHASLAERAKSPYEQAMAQQSVDQQIQIPPPPPLAPTVYGGDSRIQETAIPPSSLPTRSQSSTGYRNPKEIRANMPPDHLQQGVYQGGFL